MALSNKTENFVNLQLFISKSTEHIRNLFLESFKQKNNYEWIENRKTALKFFQNEKNKALLSKMNQTQKNLALAGDTSKWDLSLFFLILSNSEIIDKSSLKKIEKIKDVRNKIAHSSDMSLGGQEFQKYWTEVEECLISLGSNKNDIENFRLNINGNSKETKEINDKKALELKERADNFLIQLNYSKSIELYSKAIDFEMSKDLKSKIFSNRSLAYLKMFEKTNRSEKDFLFKALVDAEQSIAFNPNWFKPYARLAQVYMEFNEIPKAIENFNMALVLNPSNDEVKKLLADAKYFEFEQNRYAHLDDAAQPKTTEEHFDEHVQKVKQQIGEKNTEIFVGHFDEFKKWAMENDKNLGDVFLAHEYRDGSLKCKQNYEMAAKLYGKAAKNGNAEAMFNLAQLTIKGIGVKQNFQLAISLLKNAASQPAQKKFGMNEIPVVGVAESQHLLAIIYHQGIYVSKNMAQAIEYYQMAVNNGNGRSANNLGLLYLYGDGVASDLDRAENLFLYCHKKGCFDSISNLVELYLMKGDPDNALMWHNRALEKKLLFNISCHESVLERISKQKELLKLAKIPENKSLDSFMKEKFPQFNMLDNFCFKTNPNSIKKKNYDPEMLMEYANKGSTIAKRMLEALFLFYSAIDDFSLSQNSENFDISSTLAKMSQAFLKDSLVCQVPIDLRDQLLEKVEKVLDLNRKDDLNFNASICYMHLIASNYEQTILFIDKSLKKYPDCLHMHYIKGSMFSFLLKFREALKEFEYLVKKDPKNYEFYYWKAVALRNLEKFDNAIENYQILIKNSSKESRKIPEAYYSIGQCKIAKCFLGEKNSSRFDIVKDYIDKGEHAEQDQLPCFLPYESTSKAFLLSMINLAKTPDEIKNDHQITFQNDDNRIELIKSHRKDIKRHEGLKSNLIKNTLVPPKTQKMSFSLSILKEVKLKQIDFTKDEILDGFMINLRVFDLPQFGFTSVFFIVEDENGSVERLSVYNLGNDNDKIREDFRIGVWIAIINPYIRQAADGKPMIRVDDPKSIIFTGKYTEKMCRYCGRSDSKFNCSKCINAFYCSKECQVNDWKQLNHKLVCSL